MNEFLGLTLFLLLNVAVHRSKAGTNLAINVKLQGMNTDGTKSSGELMRKGANK
jgi:hypothetical protein